MPKLSKKLRFPLTSLLFLLSVGIGIYVNLGTGDNPPGWVYPMLALLVLAGFAGETVRHRREEKESRKTARQLDRIEGNTTEILEVISLEKVFRLPPDRIQVSALPDLHPHFTAREKELALLDAAWTAGETTNLVQFVAPGGTGKTTLVTYWLQHHLPHSGDGCPDRIYAWSFYSQGSDAGRQSSSDLFFERAAAFFGENNLPTDPRERGNRLAHLVRQSRSLLILDGIEPLQHPPGPLEGELKDPALRALLKQLAFGQPGLCLLTTRLAVRELAGVAEPAHHCHTLENLSPDAGAQLLRSLGVKGRDAELRAAAAEYKGHALALRLLGNYLADLLDGDIRRRDRIPHLSDEEHGGSHARRVMEAYVTWFDSEATGPSPEVALLHLLGLFDRPAPVAALDALLAEPDIAGLTEGLRDLDPLRLKKALQHLKKLGLLSENRLPAATPPKDLRHLLALREVESLDAHPLVREHFGQRLEKDHRAAWREANTRLYDYYRHLPEKHLPDTLEEMEPLFWAMAHGCRAGKQQEVLDEVYYERIKREDEHYSTKKLGAFGSDLTALVHLFEQVWDKPSRNMSEEDQTWTLSNAGFGLRGLGRLREAAEPMKTSLDRRIAQKNWKQAARDANNLSELYLTLGVLPQAMEYGWLSVEYADQCGDDFLKEGIRTTYADALHQSGRLEETERLFAEAEAMQRERQPEYHYLYSVVGYRYCDLLLGLGKEEEVLERVGEGLKIAVHNNWLLGTALDHLGLGRAHALLAREKATDTHVEGAEEHLNLAVEGLRKAGGMDDLPRGLLARAAWHRHRHRYAEAETDLQETLEIAESGSMGLYLADYHLEMTRLRRAQGRTEEAETHKAEALRRVKEMGYGRRLKEAEEA